MRDNETLKEMKEMRKELLKRIEEKGLSLDTDFDKDFVSLYWTISRDINTMERHR